MSLWKKKWKKRDYKNIEITKYNTRVGNAASETQGRVNG